MSSAATRNATSTFAAITCCSTRLPGAFRENTPRRGKTQCNMARSSPTISAATQSPTAGQAASPSTSATPRSLPEGSAQHSPNSLAILHSPRCCEITRAGFAVSSSPENRSFQNASKYPSQPKSSKSTRAPSCRKRGNRHRVRENAMRQRDLPERANKQSAPAQSLAQQLNSNGLRGRCYLPEESEEQNPEAHPPARTSTKVVTGASKAELRLNVSAAAQYSRPVALCPRNSLVRSHSSIEARILNCLLSSSGRSAFLTDRQHPPFRREGLRVPASVLKTSVNTKSPDFAKNSRKVVDLVTQIKNEEQQIAQGGGAKATESQHKKGRLTARERIAKLIDPGSHFFELSAYAAWEMYEEWGGAPAAGTVTGLARVCGRMFMLIANDATVKAGAFFPMTAKKVIRAQNIAIENRIPTIYLVDSAGVFLPLQEDVFPDTDDFGRVFRNNAVMSAQGIPQLTAIMGMCVAGGAYLPVMCDHILMTEGSGLFLAGPALVQAAIGQKTSAEELGGAQKHSQISGTVDFREPDDDACIARIRALVDKMGAPNPSPFSHVASREPLYPASEIYGAFTNDPGKQYDMHEIIA